MVKGLTEAMKVCTCNTGLSKQQPKEYKSHSLLLQINTFYKKTVLFIFICSFMLKLKGIGSNDKPHDLQKLKLWDRTYKEVKKKKEKKPWI